MIQERFNELEPYLRGIKVADKYTIIESILKNTWKVNGYLPENISISSKESDVKGFNHHMFYSEDETIDNMIDVLENIINVNIEIEQKQSLLKSKVEELKKMFEDKSLDELKALKFSSDLDVTLNMEKPKAPSLQIITEGEQPRKSNVTTEKV